MIPEPFAPSLALLVVSVGYGASTTSDLVPSDNLTEVSPEALAEDLPKEN